MQDPGSRTATPDTERAAGAEIVVAPQPSLIDEPVSIRLVGFPPGRRVTITARTRDDLDRSWTSRAVFLIDDDGVVDLTADEPISGSYAGADAMGLFWSMTLDAPGRGRDTTVFVKTGVDPLAVTITAEVQGKPDVSTIIRRYVVGPGVEEREQTVADDGRAGVLYTPTGSGQFPAVLVVDGAAGVGTLGRQVAALLASHGYATYTPAYFGDEGLPEDLVEIPLESFDAALDWLRTQPRVRNSRPAVVGVSPRGGELALLLGATFGDKVSAVATLTPSAAIHQGGKRRSGGGPRSPWSYQGAPLPFLRPRAPFSFVARMGVSLVYLRPLPVADVNRAALKDRAAFERAAIPIEHFQGPVLVTSGRQDLVWPSEMHGDLIVERLHAHGHPYPYEHVCYEHAGHIAALPHLPATGDRVRAPGTRTIVAFGGTAVGNAYARQDAWASLLAFLNRAR